MQGVLCQRYNLQQSSHFQDDSEDTRCGCEISSPRGPNHLSRQLTLARVSSSLNALVSPTVSTKHAHDCCHNFRIARSGIWKANKLFATPSSNHRRWKDLIFHINPPRSMYTSPSSTYASLSWRCNRRVFGPNKNRKEPRRMTPEFRSVIIMPCIPLPHALDSGLLLYTWWEQCRAEENSELLKNTRLSLSHENPSSYLGKLSMSSRRRGRP